MKDKLTKLLKNSYAPYSNYHFACIVETKSGKLYNGVNVENASFGATICAERNAVMNAISNGEKDFKALYLMTDKDEILYPCKLCQQVFLEFFDEDVIFNIMTVTGKNEVLTFKELLSKNFSKEQMK